MKIKTLIAFCLFSIVGCTQLSQQQATASEALPAIITSPSVEATAELQTVIAKLLAQSKVLLASDAFSQSSLLTLERAAHKSADGQLIMGRTTEQPWQLQLVKKADSCFVKEVASEMLVPLEMLKCRLEE